MKHEKNRQPSQARFSGGGGGGRPSSVADQSRAGRKAANTECPHCNRTFSEGVASRHIPVCAGIKAKPAAIKRSDRSDRNDRSNHRVEIKQRRRPPTAPATTSNRSRSLRSAPSSVSAAAVAVDDSMVSERRTNYRAAVHAHAYRPPVQQRVHEYTSSAPTSAWEHEEPPVELPSELDQLHALGDRKFGGARHKEHVQRSVQRYTHRDADRGMHRDVDRGRDADRDTQRITHRDSHRNISRRNDAPSRAVQKIVAAPAPTEEQDAMAAKISKLKNELDELDQLLYGKKKRRGAK